jgi:hypothetical protein
MNRRYSPRSLQGRGGAHSVLLRMAENEERAARIADLKERQPLLTWKKIADKVGVSERSTHAWRKTGAISPENAAVLADIFDVDFDYLWFGPKPGTPEMFVDRRNTPKSPVAVDRLDGEVADRIDRMDDTLQEVRRSLENLHVQREGFLHLLAAQQRVLEAIAGVLGPEALRELAGKALEPSIEEARAGLAEWAHELQESVPDPAAAGGTRGIRGSREA